MKVEPAEALRSVVPDGLDGAAFLGFLAPGFFLGRLRLLIDERIAAVLVALEIVRCGFAAQVTVDTLVIDEI